MKTLLIQKKSKKKGGRGRGNRMTEEEEDTELLAASKEAVRATRLTVQPNCIKFGTMRDYQIEGLNWLISLYDRGINGILADEMGLGKTCQSACFLQHLWKNEPVGKKSLREVGQFLVVAPLSTLEHWQREIETWTELHSVIYHGSEVERQTIVDTDVFYSNGNKMVLKTLFL